jgi:isopenicillin-N epimerase
MSTPSTTSLSRREAIKLGLVGFSGAILTGCSDPDAPAVLPPPIDRSALAVEAPAWPDVRAHFLLAPGVVYLNNSSIGLPPSVVTQRVSNGYLSLSTDPIHAKHALQDAFRDEVMPALSRWFCAPEEALTVTRNASVALHLQGLGVRLETGDEVIITTQEHPGGQYPWTYRKNRHGIVIREVFIPSPLPDDADIVAAFEQAVTPRTRAIAFCHVTRGGHVYPVGALCEWARSRGLVSLVDGAQAVGRLPVDLTSLGCDAYAASLHKWMLAPAGTGFLYLRPESRHRFHSLFDPMDDPSRFGVPGTLDFPVRAAIGAAIGFLESMGIETIEQRCRFLSDHFDNRINGQSGVTMLSGARERSAPGTSLFQLAGVDAVHAVDRLAPLQIDIDEHQRDGHDAIRISAHVYNSTEDLDLAADALLALRPA